MSHRQRLVIGVSRFSGPHYGIRLLEVLRPIGSVESHLVMSRAARTAIEHVLSLAAVDKAAARIQLLDEWLGGRG